MMGFSIAHSWLLKPKERIRQAGHTLPVLTSIFYFQSACLTKEHAL